MANSGLIIQQSSDAILLTCEQDGMSLTVESTDMIIMSTEGQPGRDGQVVSVTGLNTDNTDPANPVVRISVDGTTITGLGTPGSPLTASGSAGAVWGEITGDILDQTDLQDQFDTKQGLNANLTSVAGLSTINTIYYLSAVGTFSPVTIGANLSFSGGTLSSTAVSSVAWGDITGTLSNQTDLQNALNAKVTANGAITGATKTKITYDAKGLVTAGADAGISDITGLQTALNSKYDASNPSAFISSVSVLDNTLVGDGTAGNPLGVNFVGNPFELTFYDDSGQLNSNSNAVHYPDNGANYYDDDLTRIAWKQDRDKYANWDASNLSGARTIEFQDASGVMAYLADIPSISGLVPYTGATANVDLGTFDLITDTITSDSSAGLILENASGGDVLHIGNGGGVNATAYGGWNFDAATANTLAYFGASKTLSSVTLSGLTLTTGTLSVDAASDTVAGKVELATTAETNTGTDTARAVTPDGLAGSYAGTKSVSISVTAPTENTATGDGKAYITIPEALNGMNLVRATATVVTAGTTNATTIQIYNVTQTADMLSGLISIASGGTVATAGTIDTANDDVATNDVLRVDVDTISTTPAKGLMVILEFRLP